MRKILTDEQVTQMRQLREQRGWSYGRIAIWAKCPYWTARDILTYRTRT